MIALALWVYGAAEVGFYILYHRYLLPSANKRVPVHPYRDYGVGHRHRIILRAMERLVLTAQGQSTKEAIQTFLLSWFQSRGQNAVADSPSFEVQDDQENQQPRRSERSNKSAVAATMKQDVATAERNNSNAKQQPRWTIEELGRLDMDCLFGWAAFGKDVTDLDEDELNDLEKTFVGCEEMFGLFFREGSTQKYMAKRVNLDDVSVSHRPLIFYIVVGFVRVYAAIWLIGTGFRPRRSQSGMIGWFRPARKQTNQIPLLFFHGIAPGGMALYLPMVLNGLATDERAVFLFENSAISMDLFSGLKPLTQQEILDGVHEIIYRSMPNAADFAVVGHSFGTAPLTWLLYCPKMRHRIRQAVLLDPITILLTTPDVINSFLYSTKATKFRLASTELLVQNYVRRHFPYYNSDFWFEDLPAGDCQVLVCLSEKDDVINASRVRHEAERHLHRQQSDRVIFWDKSGHGDCIFQRRKWAEIKQWMLQQESSLLHKLSRTIVTRSHNKHGDEEISIWPIGMALRRKHPARARE